MSDSERFTTQELAMTPKTFYSNAPSAISAILWNKQEDFDQILAICCKGQVLAFSSETNYRQLMWAKQIELDDHFTDSSLVGHAVINLRFQEIYFVAYSTSGADTSEICSIDTDIEDDVEIVISNSVLEGRQVNSLAFEPETQLLFVCDYPGLIKDISIWTLNSRLLASMRMPSLTIPSHCSLHLNEDDGLLLLAISIATDSIVYVTSFKGSTEFLKDLKMKQHSSEMLVIRLSEGEDSVMMSKLVTVAERGEPRNKLGYVDCPEEVTFDSNGDLYVADFGRNRRIQSFSLKRMGNNEFKSTPNWASPSIGPMNWSICVAGSGNIVVFGKFGSKSLAILSEETQKNQKKVQVKL